MDPTIIKLYDENRGALRVATDRLVAKDDYSVTYEKICVVIAKTLLWEKATVLFDDPDPDYQGTLYATFEVPDGRVWVSRIDYGSCSGCDELESALSDLTGVLRCLGVFGVAVNIIQGMEA